MAPWDPWHVAPPTRVVGVFTYRAMSTQGSGYKDLWTFRGLVVGPQSSPWQGDTGVGAPPLGRGDHGGETFLTKVLFVWFVGRGAAPPRKGRPP